MIKQKSTASILADEYLAKKFEERIASLSDEELAEQSISSEEAIELGYDPEEEQNKPEWLKKEGAAEAELCLRALDQINQTQEQK